MTTITDYSKYDLDIRKTFNSIDGDTLLDMDLPATKFVIKDLLPQGLAIIGGSPKVGKSWLINEYVKLNQMLTEMLDRKRWAA